MLLAMAACGSSDDSPSADGTDAPDPAPTPAPADIPEGPYGTFRAAPTACGGAQPDPVTLMTFDRPQDESLDVESTLTATIATSCGDLVIELDPGIAPLAVNSFVFLAKQGFYNGVVSHRIMPGFMFQVGDQTATGSGDAGYRILLDEWPGPGFSYDRGVVAMANSGPQSTGSQFFIMMGPSALPPNYTVIGRLVGGDSVLDNIAAIPVAARAGGEESLPLESLYINSVTIVE